MSTKVPNRFPTGTKMIEVPLTDYSVGSKESGMPDTYNAPLSGMFENVQRTGFGHASKLHHNVGAGHARRFVGLAGYQTRALG
jgi:hypothetical protein